MFLKYYKNIFVPFIQSFFQKNARIYWAVAFFYLLLPYWNVYRYERQLLPVDIILISGLVTYCIYCFSFFMFFCKLDGLFDSFHQHISTLIFNLLSTLFPVLFFISYFTGLFMIHYIRAGAWFFSNNLWFIFPSLIIGLTISNHQFARWRVDTNNTADETSVNKMLLIAFILTGLVIGIYFAVYYFVPKNYFVLAVLALSLSFLVLYINSIKRANQRLVLNAST